MDDASANPLDVLTPRQRECLERAAGHWTSKDIGRSLGISPKTVDRHLEEAIRRLGVTDRMAAVRKLRAAGQLSGNAPVIAISAYGDDPHRERAPQTPASPPGQSVRRGGETIYGETAADVHVDRRGGRPGPAGRNTATEEGGVLVAGTIEGGFGDLAVGRALGGDHKFGAAPSGRAFRTFERAPGPFRRLGWILAIAAGLALTAGAIAGSYDLLLGFHRLAPTAAASPNPAR
jgi:DNA-binding CsgD family transcriptional regulator